MSLMHCFLSMQEEVYQATTKGLIEGLISGYNATVFAYGPTGLCLWVWVHVLCIIFMCYYSDPRFVVSLSQSAHFKENNGFFLAKVWWENESCSCFQNFKHKGQSIKFLSFYFSNSFLPPCCPSVSQINFPWSLCECKQSSGSKVGMAGCRSVILTVKNSLLQQPFNIYSCGNSWHLTVIIYSLNMNLNQWSNCKVNFSSVSFAALPFRLWENVHYVGNWQGAGHLRPHTERFVSCHRGDQWRHAVQRIYVLSGGTFLLLF